MATHPEYGVKTTATEVAAAFSREIKGKNVVVTGVSPTSIGSYTALAIAAHEPANLILASRTESKIVEVIEDIKKKYPNVPLHSVTLNLREVDSIKAAADKISSLVDHLDVLINNAGISHSARDAVVTPNGTRTDLQFFNNHLGPFLLTSLLLPRLVAAGEKSPPGATRVINLTSNGHRLSPVRFSDYAFDRGIYDGVPEPERPGANLPAFLTKTNDGFPGFMGYGQSKSANVLHATEISRRLKRAGRGNVVGFAVHPGSIMTDLSRTLDPDSADAVTKTAPAHLWKTHDAGAATSVCAAFDPKLGQADLGGSVLGYMADCQLQDDLVAPHAADADIAKRLWDESEKMLQITTGF